MNRDCVQQKAVCCGVLAALIGLTLSSPRCHAADEALVAKCLTFNGAVLERTEGSWKAIKEKQGVDGGSLVVALPRAFFLSKDENVEMRMLADIGQRGPFPVLESAVVFNKPKDNNISMDVTFDRGIIVFVNRKKEGAAKVKIRFRDETWTLTLRQPKTKVGLELYSRHLPGLPKIVDGKIQPPTTYVALLVVEGTAFLNTGEEGVALTQPPGRARVQWESGTDFIAVQKLDKLPESLLKAPTKEEAKLFSQICSCAAKLSVAKLSKSDAGELLDLFLKSRREIDRKVGVTSAGAIDDLPRLIGCLEDKKHPDVRDHAILVLRHWMGRSQSHVKDLYEALKKKGYSDIHARTILQLLFGFGPEHRKDPDSFILLNAFLQHSQLPIRELAHWHLVRLAPAGKNIPYDAAAAADERAKAVKQWQDLIPPGKLPPKPPIAENGKTDS